jgi:hypothetical protein
MEDQLKIEELVGYKFSNRKLLMQSFTHASMVNTNSPCYQRLEFLGDAVLEVRPRVTGRYADYSWRWWNTCTKNTLNTILIISPISNVPSSQITFCRTCASKSDCIDSFDTLAFRYLLRFRTMSLVWRIERWRRGKMSFGWNLRPPRYTPQRWTGQR